MELEGFTFEMFRVVQERFFYFIDFSNNSLNNEIALALASSGIAATLLEGCRTANSALKLTFNIQSNETSTCNILKTSAMAKVLQQCKLIVWDKCTMAHKKSLEALERTMSLRNKQN